LLTAGCQKVDQEKTVSIGPGDVVAPMIVDAPRSEQKIVVTVVGPPGVPVRVHVVREKDRAGLEEKLKTSKKLESSEFLAASPGAAEDTTLEATIPAGTEYAVVLSGAAKSGEVKVKLKSK
jgi:hypothetical protein